MKGVVLCGGEGARLRPLSYYFAKAMVSIGQSQRPRVLLRLRTALSLGIAMVRKLSAILVIPVQHVKGAQYLIE